MEAKTNPGTQDTGAVLLAHGITPTVQRLQIAALLLGGNQHFSADQIIARLRDSRVSISKATVYNTLGLFAEKGLIREVIVDPTRVFYDTNTSAHYHFYHVDEGVLSDIDVGDIALAALPAAPAGTAMESIDIILRVRRQPDAV